jgi:PAS domain S-box-containing protein
MEQPLAAEERAALLSRIASLDAEVAMLSDFLENANTPLHSVGPDGVVRWANRAELAALGYGREEYVGHPIAEFHADPRALTDLLDRLGRGEAVSDYPALLRRRDGSIRKVLITSSALVDDGELVRTRCFTRDADPEAQDKTLWLCIGPTLEIKVQGDCFTIGRTPPADLILRDANVSRRHCRIERSQGAYYLHDEGSTCGVELSDGSQLGGAKKLEEGDGFRIGHELVRCTFRTG